MTETKFGFFQPSPNQQACSILNLNLPEASGGRSESEITFKQGDKQISSKAIPVSKCTQHFDIRSWILNDFPPTRINFPEISLSIRFENEVQVIRFPANGEMNNKMKTQSDLGTIGHKYGG